MSKKSKQIVWHKKSGKFLPSSALRPHGTEVHSQGQSGSQPPPAVDRKKAFWQNLKAQIKRAIAESK